MPDLLTNMKIMKYAYIATLVLVLAGMFYFGERTVQSPEVTYSNAPLKELDASYTKRDYCAPEISTETSKYELELSAAQNRISELESELELLKASGTPTPTPSVTEAPSVTPTPTESEAPADDNKASTSANR